MDIKKSSKTIFALTTCLLVMISFIFSETQPASSSIVPDVSSTNFSVASGHLQSDNVVDVFTYNTSGDLNTTWRTDSSKSWYGGEYYLDISSGEKIQRGSTSDFILSGPILFVDGTYRMWYSYFNGTRWRVYHTTSTDGISGWTAPTTVLSYVGGGTFDSHSVKVGSVIYDENAQESERYKMWYFGGPDTNTREGIGYVTSSDGITWSNNRSLTPILTGPGGSWATSYSTYPSVVYNDGAYKMWYNTFYDSKWMVGHATSLDGITWSENIGSVLSPTVGTWDANHIYAPMVTYRNGFYEMWYTGYNSGLSTDYKTGRAKSSDGIIWTKNTSNPVLNQWSFSPRVYYNAGKRFIYYGANKAGVNNSVISGIISNAFEIDGDFPAKAYVVAGPSSVDIIDASANQPWMKIEGLTYWNAGATVKSVFAQNGKLYITASWRNPTDSRASQGFLYTFDFIEDSISTINFQGQKYYLGTIADWLSNKNYIFSSIVSYPSLCKVEITNAGGFATYVGHVSGRIINGEEYVVVTSDTGNAGNADPHSSYISLLKPNDPGYYSWLATGINTTEIFQVKPYITSDGTLYMGSFVNSSPWTLRRILLANNIQSIANYYPHNNNNRGGLFAIYPSSSGWLLSVPGQNGTAIGALTGAPIIIENTGKVQSCPGTSQSILLSSIAGTTLIEDCKEKRTLSTVQHWTNNATASQGTVHNILTENRVNRATSDGKYLWLGQHTVGLAEIDLSNPGQRVYYSTVSSPAIASNTVKALSYGSLLVGTSNGASLLTTTTSSEPEPEVLYVGGDFTTAGGKPSSYIAKLLLSESTPPPGDNIPPVITITSSSPASGISNTFVDVSFTVTDDTAINSNGVSVSGAGNPNLLCDVVSPTALSCSVLVWESGMLTIDAIDVASNSASTFDIYFIDKDEPTTTLSTDCPPPGNDPWCKSSSVLVTIEGSDPNSGSGVDKIYYKIGGDPNDLINGWTEVSDVQASFSVATQGQSVIYHYATDKAGNDSSQPVLSSSVYIDSQNPSMPSISPVTGVYNNGTTLAPLIVSWSASADQPSGSGVSGYVLCESFKTTPSGTFGDDVCTPTTNLSWSEDTLVNGHVYRYKVKAIDNAGNESAFTSYIEITINRAVPTSPSISCATPSGNAPYSNGDATVSWGIPVVGAGLSISKYNLYRSSDTWPSVPADPFDSNFYKEVFPPTTWSNESGLSASTIYKYQVNALDNASPTPNVGDPSGVCQLVVDTEAPVTVVDIQDPASPNTHGWYNVDVSFKLDVSDDISGVDPNYPEYSLNGGAWVSASSKSFNVLNESANNTLQVRSKDNAGNLEAAVDIYTSGSPLKIDKSDPVANNHITQLSGNVLNISLDGVDSISGIETVISRVYDHTTGDLVAGSETSLTRTSGDANSGHWEGSYDFGGAVTGVFVVKTTLVDYAGNSIIVYNSGDPLALDNTPPTIVISSPTKTSNNNILNTTITITDAGGISANKVSITSSTIGTTSFSCQNVDDDPNEVLCSVIIISTSDEFNTANNKLAVTAIDDADNSNTVTESGYLIDDIAPTVSLSFNPPAPSGMGGWYTSDVAATITASDSGGAGLNKVYYKVVENGNIPVNFTEVSASSLPININISTEGSTYILYYADDNFGNESAPKPAQSTNTNIDKTNPSATGLNNASGIITKLGGSTNPPLILSWNASSDPGAYASGLYGYNIYRDGPGGLTILFSDSIMLEQAGLADGAYTYKIASVDNAGRQSAMSAEINITIDATSPLPTDVSCLPWINTDTNNLVWPEATDILSGIDRHEIDRDPVFTPTNPVPVDMPTLFYSDSPLVNETSYIYRVRGVDLPSNFGIYGNTCTTTVDMDPPVTTPTVSGTEGASGWYRGGVSFSLDAIDPGTLPSGFYISEYKLDDGSFANFTAPISISSEGTVSISYRSKDHAGNIEDDIVFDLKIDNTAPSISVLSQSYDTGTDELAVVVNAFDGLSGVSSVSMRVENGGVIARPFDLDYDSGSDSWSTAQTVAGLSGNYNIVYIATDYAGNETVFYSPVSLGVASVNTAPDINYIGQPSQIVGTGLVSFTFSIKDDEGDDITVTPSLLGGLSCSMSSLTTTTPGVNIAGVVMAISGVSITPKSISVTWDAKADCGGNYDTGVAIRLIASDSQSSDSDDSETFLIDTKNPVLPSPSSDFNLIIKETGTDSVTLELGPNGLSDDTTLIYKIFFQEGTSGVNPSTSTPLTQSPFITSYVPGTTYLVDGLDPNTDYVFNIYGYDLYGNFTSATEVAVKTDDSPLPPVFVPEPSLLSIEVRGYEQDEAVDGETTNIPAEDNVINFGEVESGENRLSALTIDGFTNYGSGYSLLVYQNHDLRSAEGNSISKFDANTGVPVPNSDPVPWVIPNGVGYFGYSTTSLERFNLAPRRYAAFSGIESQGVIAEHNDPGEYSDSLILQVEIGPDIKPGVYSNTITIVAVPNLP